MLVASLARPTVSAECAAPGPVLAREAQVDPAERDRDQYDEDVGGDLANGHQVTFKWAGPLAELARRIEGARVAIELLGRPGQRVGAFAGPSLAREPAARGGLLAQLIGRLATGHLLSHRIVTRGAARA